MRILLGVGAAVVLLVSCVRVPCGTGDPECGHGLALQALGSVHSVDTRILYATSPAYAGNLGGAAGGDAICSTDPNKPTQRPDAEYRAVLAAGFGQRSACQSAHCSDAAENVDWVLKPHTVYVDVHGAVILTTNGGGIHDFRTGALSLPIESDGGLVWTGLNADWTQSSFDCGAWGTAVGSGTAGDSSASATGSISFTNQPCATLSALYCAEQ